MSRHATRSLARWQGLGLTVLAGLATLPLHAAEPAQPDQSQLLRQLADRIERLEKQNQALEDALDRDNLSEKDPQLATRLKATEAQTLNMQASVGMLEALEGIRAGVSFTTLVQRANRGVQPDGNGGSELNYRGDVNVELPGGSLGEAEGRLVAQVRLGQGAGLGASVNRFSPGNAAAFQLGGTSQPDDSGVLLAQLWYQMSFPLLRNSSQQQANQALDVTFGKIDPYLFFDQNAAANDETRQFLNSIFVHNALLDAGGDTGTDAYGYAPGVIVQYRNEASKPMTFGLSAGVFATASGAQFSRSLSSPLVIVQAETGQKLIDGLDGNFRVYFWRNGQSSDFDQTKARHAGWGASADQRLGDALTLFARVGQHTRGRVPFDQTLTGGVEIGGTYWGRSADAFGIALGRQRSSADFRADSATLDADGDGNPDFGYPAQGAEQVAELYYRYRVHGQFELSPDFQILRRPGANRAESAIKTIGLRAQVNF